MGADSPRALAALTVDGLAPRGRCADRPCEAACISDRVVFSLQDESGEAIGADYQCSGYKSPCWGRAQIAASRGLDCQEVGGT